MNHRNAHRDLVEPYVLGALTADERAAFESHLAGCGRCAAEVRALAPIAEALASLASPAEPSEAVRARLMQLIRAGGQPAPAPRMPVPAWMALAASLILAVVLGAYVVSLRRDVAGAAQADRLMAAVLSAPDLARIDLAGQSAAPSASARAFWSRSRGLVITASNLPALPTGRVYQLWVLTAQPAPTSAGLFRPGADGKVAAAFHTPPDIPAPVAVAVTLEPEGGVPAPTGAKYLVGVAN